MNQTDYPASNASFHVEGLLRFFGAFRWFGLCVHSQRGKKSETASDEHRSPTPQCDCGGYNEAFVMQHWANYDPIR